MQQRRHGPARLQALLLPQDDHDPRRPDREAAQVRPEISRFDFESDAAAHFMAILWAHMGADD